ncbi:MAG: alcohol dehydrogenase, partial [Microbacterium sp.]|nr:alcohol dehydrogenase [Microbacterium sp.]
MKTIVLAGATSASGLAVTRALITAGMRVVATGRSADRLQPLADAGARIDVADATSLDDMIALAERLASDGLTVDAVVPLVGGWRGGGGLAGQSDEDFA